MPDIILRGETYRGWHIKVTPARPDEHFYEIAEPGQKPTGILPGLPFETLDECVNAAKQRIDREIEQNGGVGN